MASKLTEGEIKRIKQLKPGKKYVIVIRNQVHHTMLDQLRDNLLAHNISALVIMGGDIVELKDAVVVARVEEESPPGPALIVSANGKQVEPADQFPTSYVEKEP